jgi:autotransporter adhesin
LAVGVGTNASAGGAQSVAIGLNANASATDAFALGTGSTAAFSGSTAIGANAVTTAVNQVSLGAAGTSVRVGDIAASTAAQQGPVNVVTVDANGTLGRQATASAQSVAAVRSQMELIAAVSDSQFSALQSEVNTLFDLRQHDRKDFKQGIAAVAAMAQPHFPSEAGKTSYASNVAVFRGEVGVSAGVAHRFEGDFAFTAGATFAGGKNTAVRAGIAGEF